ncbi:MafI family immunity protein [Leclercia sp. EC_58]|uniref:MafI family immunity protein n=1 Tax=Leclercia sp. EC_58 TaxID=2584090 RepID=UPI001C70509D|nr:MafI family immunity protein [Leclercia sp. EC_58]MBW9398687.1 MafI family immunity protein [Leclercia sp. EC_58]
MKELDEEIRIFGSLFMNRLDKELLQYAINYVDYDERGLAFETICDHLSEYNVPITLEEYEIAIKLCKTLQMDINDISIKHLKTLIVS